MTMARTKTKNRCKKIRGWLYSTVSGRFGPGSEWLQNHISKCPRCQRRFAAYCKVNLALSLMKSKPHRFDLLMRANTQAIGVLKHSLRRAQKARKLRVMRPEPKLLENLGKYGHSVANLAACVAVLLLMKIGVFSSMNRFQNQGQRVMKQYYASRVGEDLADEIFQKDARQA